MSKLREMLNYIWSGVRYGFLTYFVAVLSLIIFIEGAVMKAYNTVKRWATFNGLEIALYACYFIFTLLLFGCTWKNGYEAGKKAFSGSYVSDTVTVTEVRYDTIIIKEPEPVYVTKWKTIRDTFYIPQDDCYKIAEITVDDLYYRQDSLYELWLKGAYVQLDSVKVYPRTDTVFRTITNRQKPKKWGLGIQVGYGGTIGRLYPYVGIGVQYNILQW